MSFKNILGQDQPIEILKQSIGESRLGLSYLFSGPEGVGKKLAAKTLAKALNCQNQSLDPCDGCISCLKIEKNQHPDIHMIDASWPIEDEEDRPETRSSAIKIGHIRQLKKIISLRPYEARVKVFIIDNAHNLTAEASHAFLKILEEPPAKSLLILVSAKPARLFKTIISRCQVLKFYPMARPRMEDILRTDYGLHMHLAHFLAYFCEGRLGLALSLKDTDILTDKNRVINQFVMAKSTIANDYLMPKRDQARRSLNILMSWFRDIYLIKTGTPFQEMINLDRKAELLKFMPQYSFTDLDNILNAISEALFYLEQNINTRLLLLNLRQNLWRG